MKVKRPSFKSLKTGVLAFCRSTPRSTEPEVGRPGGRPMCTNVHKLVWLEGRSTNQVDHQRALLSRSDPGRSGGRPTAGFPAELASNGHILGAYKLGLPWTVFDKIFGEFSSYFFLHLLVFISTCFRAKTSISKGEFFKSIL